MQVDILLSKYASFPPKIRYGSVAGIFVLLIVAFYFLSIEPNWLESKDLDKKLANLKALITQREIYLANLAHYEERIKELQKSLDLARDMLPNTDNVPQFLAQLGEKAEETNVLIDEFTPLAAEVKDNVSAKRYHIKAQGSYHETASFIDAVVHLNRIVNVGDITLLDPRIKNKKVILRSDFTLTTYRYVPPSPEPMAEEEKK